METYMKKYKSSSTIKPLNVDDKSSPTTVYINTNVVEKEIKDDMSKETRTMYFYDVVEYTRDEYFKLKTSSNIEFLAMEIGVDV